ncbi:phosphatase PAP2 family protein [Nakamurella sp.]|uniref:phosphatase PAP2 family protein n=1 Tax=Nakamurella sp. TaxID=1869182 RepID=UPI003B3ADC18
MRRVRGRAARRRVPAAALAVAVAVAVAPVGPVSAAAPDRPDRPDLVKTLAGFDDLWSPDPARPFQGTVTDAAVLRRNDELAVWINRHATPAQQFTALQDSAYGRSPAGYDQSITIATGLGSVLGPLYVSGRQSGALPLTSALLNSADGSAGAFQVVGAAKVAFAYPRPFLPTDPSTPVTPGDNPTCAPAGPNASALTGERVGRSYADANGNLAIVRVAPTVDDTHRFTDQDVTLDAGYGSPDLCTAGSFPSGHALYAFEVGVTLATLLPELGPEILARASENANDRVVLGVHYPLDVMAGRMGAQEAMAALWSDEQFRTTVLEPARTELVGYLQSRCGDTLATCIAAQAAYRADPYGGAVMPGGTAQVVSDRASAVAVAGERLDYRLPPAGPADLAPAVPDGAENLLLTTFPTLTEAQRRAVLAQTGAASGAPLDLSAAGRGSWQRIDLAAAMSAAVRLDPAGGVTVTAVGGPASVRTAAGSGPAASAPRSDAPESAAAGPAEAAAPAGFSAALGWSVVGLVVLLGGLAVVILVRRRRPTR